MTRNIQIPKNFKSDFSFLQPTMTREVYTPLHLVLGE